MIDWKGIESGLNSISSHSFITPYTAFLEIKKLLSSHGFFFNESNIFPDILDDEVLLYFQLAYPGSYIENPLFLLMNFYIDDGYRVHVSLISKEEMDEHL